MLNFNFLSVLILFLLITGCSSNKPAVPTAPAVEDLTVFKKNCDENHVALACAQYGYKIKKDDLSAGLIYTKKACDLKHEQSCFNMVQIKDRAIEQNAKIIREHLEEIRSCYVVHTVKNDKRGFSLKNPDDQKVLKLQFMIDQNGNLAKFNLRGKKLTEEIKNCVNTIYASKKFIGTDRPQIINMGFVMPVADDTPNPTATTTTF